MTLGDKLLIYRSKYPSEGVKVHKCVQLLEAGPGCFMRDSDPGHFTGSAWVVNTDFTKTLLVRHRKLRKWVQLLLSDESHDIGWIELDHLEEYTGEESILRMRKKWLQSV